VIYNTPAGSSALTVDSVDWNTREMNGGQLGQIPQNFFDQRIQPNYELGGAFCAVSGIWYPTSMLRIDGYGRTVGVDYWVPDVPDLPF
jgi:hypothetical protein